MIKIRLWGKIQEVQESTEELKKAFDIKSISQAYRDRQGELVRVYIDAESKNKK